MVEKESYNKKYSNEGHLRESIAWQVKLCTKYNPNTPLQNKINNLPQKITYTFMLWYMLLKESEQHYYL